VCDEKKTPRVRARESKCFVTLRIVNERFSTQQHTITHCNVLQRTATHCHALRHFATHCNTLQHTATYCNTLHHTATYCNILQHTATHCNTLQHTAAHCNTLQHTATHYNTLQLQHTAPLCSELFVTPRGKSERFRQSQEDSTLRFPHALLSLVVHFLGLQHTATHCNTLQHTATHTAVYCRKSWKESNRFRSRRLDPNSC